MAARLNVNSEVARWRWPTVAGFVVTLLTLPAHAETIAIADLPHHTHIHGLAVDTSGPPRLLIATHHGLFRAREDGKAERISEVMDLMGFSPHPRDSKTYFASGHPSSGGNLGFIASTDGGRKWLQLSPGVGGPVDFHQLTVSPADPKTIYGVYGGLQVSRDGGQNWTLVGPEPPAVIALAASARSADRLYAATDTGMLISDDGGKSWRSHIAGLVSLVHVTPDGTLYAFVRGRGLIRSAEEPLKFVETGHNFGSDLLLHLATDPTNPNHIYAATTRRRLLVSLDAGRTWKSF